MNLLEQSTASRSGCNGVAAGNAADKGEAKEVKGRSPTCSAASRSVTHDQEQQQHRRKHQRQQQHQQQQHPHLYYASKQQVQRQVSLTCQQQEGNSLQQQTEEHREQDDSEQQQRRLSYSLKLEHPQPGSNHSPEEHQRSYERQLQQRQQLQPYEEHNRTQHRYQEGPQQHEEQQQKYPPQQKYLQQQNDAQQQKIPQQQQEKEFCHAHELSEQIEAADYWGVLGDVEEATAVAAAAEVGPAAAGARQTAKVTRGKRGGLGKGQALDERENRNRLSTDGGFQPSVPPSLSSSSACALPASPDDAPLHSFSSFSAGAPTQASLIKTGGESSAPVLETAEANVTCISAGAAVSAFLKGRPKSGYVPYNPYRLSRSTRQLLEWTELPFVILWIYFTYFIVIVSLTAPKVKKLVWVNAVVAGSLVGLGLNANAYRAIMYRGYPDIGMIVRFFLIPFGVSALAGLTNSLRERFVLVFPKDPLELLLAVACPAVVVTVLLVGRLFILYTHHVPITLRNFVLNGRVYF